MLYYVLFICITLTRDAVAEKFIYDWSIIYVFFPFLKSDVDCYFFVLFSCLALAAITGSNFRSMVLAIGVVPIN